MVVLCLLTASNRGYFIEWLLERPDVRDVWKEFVHHPFVMAIGAGTRPLESFKSYTSQDYLYLVRTTQATAASIWIDQSSTNAISV